MRCTRFAIVGGGLSGLYAAKLLEKHGIADYLLIEARNVLGGRIATALASGNADSQSATVDYENDRVDLGPTWFWPTFHRHLDRLLDELNLKRFAQHVAGEMVAERNSNVVPARLQELPYVPKGMRLAGGMGALIHALRERVDGSCIVTGRTVRRLRVVDHQVEVECFDSADNATVMLADHVLLAMPPRLVVNTITFAPSLPSRSAKQWRATPTSMATHARYVAIYDTAFWRQEGLSGEGRSAVGPLVEVHDASMPGGSAALGGLIVSVDRRKALSSHELRLQCRAQLARLFGPKAAAPKHDVLKDWALDPLTASSDDHENGLSHHTVAPSIRASCHPWKTRMTCIGSEWSANFPGYLAGAIDAATVGVEAVLGLTCATPLSLRR